MCKWPSAVATYYMHSVFCITVSACQHPVLHCWLGNSRMNIFPGNFLALGHSCPTKSLVLSLQSDWALVTRGDRHQRGQTLDHQGDAGSSRYGEVSDNGYVYVFIKSQCFGQTSFGVSTHSQLGVRFSRVISPWSRSSIRTLNCRIDKRVNSLMTVFRWNGQSSSALKGLCASRDGEQEIARSATSVYCMCRTAWSRVLVKLIVAHVSKKLWAPVYPRHSVYKRPLLVPALRRLNSVCSTNTAYSLFLFVYLFLRRKWAWLNTGDVAVFIDLFAATASSLYGGQSR